MSTPIRPWLRQLLITEVTALIQWVQRQHIKSEIKQDPDFDRFTDGGSNVTSLIEVSSSARDSPLQLVKVDVDPANGNIFLILSDSDVEIRAELSKQAIEAYQEAIGEKIDVGLKGDILVLNEFAVRVTEEGLDSEHVKLLINELQYLNTLRKLVGQPLSIEEVPEISAQIEALYRFRNPQPEGSATSRQSSVGHNIDDNASSVHSQMQVDEPEDMQTTVSTQHNIQTQILRSPTPQRNRKRPATDIDEVSVTHGVNLDQPRAAGIAKVQRRDAKPTTGDPLLSLFNQAPSHAAQSMAQSSTEQQVVHEIVKDSILSQAEVTSSRKPLQPQSQTTRIVEETVLSQPQVSTRIQDMTITQPSNLSKVLMPGGASAQLHERAAKRKEGGGSLPGAPDSDLLATSSSSVKPREHAAREGKPLHKTSDKHQAFITSAQRGVEYSTTTGAPQPSAVPEKQRPVAQQEKPSVNDTRKQPSETPNAQRSALTKRQRVSQEDRFELLSSAPRGLRLTEHQDAFLSSSAALLPSQQASRNTRINVDVAILTQWRERRMAMGRSQKIPQDDAMDVDLPQATVQSEKLDKPETSDDDSDSDSDASEEQNGAAAAAEDEESSDDEPIPSSQWSISPSPPRRPALPPDSSGVIPATQTPKKSQGRPSTAGSLEEDVPRAMPIDVRGQHIANRRAFMRPEQRRAWLQSVYGGSAGKAFDAQEACTAYNAKYSTSDSMTLDEVKVLYSETIAKEWQRKKRQEREEQEARARAAAAEERRREEAGHPIAHAERKVAKRKNSSSDWYQEDQGRINATTEVVGEQHIPEATGVNTQVGDPALAGAETQDDTNKTPTKQGKRKLPWQHDTEDMTINDSQALSKHAEIINGRPLPDRTMQYDDARVSQGHKHAQVTQSRREDIKHGKLVSTGRKRMPSATPNKSSGMVPGTVLKTNSPLPQQRGAAQVAAEDVEVLDLTQQPTLTELDVFARNWSQLHPGGAFAIRKNVKPIEVEASMRVLSWTFD